MGADASIRNQIVALVALGPVSGRLCRVRASAGRASGFGRSRAITRSARRTRSKASGIIRGWIMPMTRPEPRRGTARRSTARPTANGETFDLTEVSAAHKTLQLPSVVEVTNLQNGRALKVRVNDRGPFAGDRIIDLSRRAAQLLGFERAGTAPVRVKIIKEESIKVAEAAMRGDIGQIRLAQETRPARTSIAAAGRTRAGSGRHRAPLRTMAVARRCARGLAGAGPRSLSPLPAEPPPPVASGAVRSKQPKMGRRAPARLAHAGRLGARRANARARRPTTRRRAAIRPDFYQAGMFAVAENAEPVAGALRRDDRRRGVARQRQRQCPVPGEAGAGGERGRGAAFAWKSSRKAEFLTPGSSRN